VLPGAGEKGDKLMGGWPQVADAPIGGQGSDVQQNAGGAVKRHDLIMDATLVHAKIDVNKKLIKRNNSCKFTSATLIAFSYLCRVRRGPGGPRDSRPGGRRYLFLQRPATLTQARDPLYTNRQNALTCKTKARILNGCEPFCCFLLV
jgi:hypothetical protein